MSRRTFPLHGNPVKSRCCHRKHTLHTHLKYGQTRRRELGNVNACYHNHHLSAAPRHPITNMCRFVRPVTRIITKSKQVCLHHTRFNKMHFRADKINARQQPTGLHSYNAISYTYLFLSATSTGNMQWDNSNIEATKQMLSAQPAGQS